MEKKSPCKMSIIELAEAIKKHYEEHPLEELDKRIGEEILKRTITIECED